jgi:hypothetical protein
MNRPYIKVFFTWYLLLKNEDKIPSTCLEISFIQWNGKPICYKFEDIKRMRSDEWVKKYLKLNIAYLKDKKLKAIRKQENYYFPTILYALGDVQI